jgi:TRAP-type transport system small permease protein
MRFQRLVRGLSLGLAIIAGVLLLAMMVIISAEVVQRAFLNTSFLLVEEYSGYLVLTVLAFGVPFALIDGALLRVDIVLNFLKTGVRRKLQIAFDLISLAFSCVLAYHFTLFALKNFSRGSFAPTPMMTPLFIPQFVVAVGFCLLVVALLAQIINGLSGRDVPEEDVVEKMSI